MVILSGDRVPSLLSYKYFIRPTAHKLYGRNGFESKHQENVQKILKILALNGPMTTWDMAKTKFATDNDSIHTKEKEYRRLLIGRRDRGRHSQGILELNLVVVDSISTKRNPGKKYRLSLFGILYCLDSLDLTHSEIDKLVKSYSDLLPLVFGKWDFLKSIIGDNVFNISMLGKGLLFDNPNLIKITNSTFYELITYFNVKSNTLSQSMTEKNLGELISLWFYVSLLYFPEIMDGKMKKRKNYLEIIFEKEPVIKNWFSVFIHEAYDYYQKRSESLKQVSFV